MEPTKNKIDMEKNKKIIRIIKIADKIADKIFGVMVIIFILISLLLIFINLIL